MQKYKSFELTDEIISNIKNKSEIPVDFHNKNGQVLIHKKMNATEHEINKLLNFVKQGIYFDENEAYKLGLNRRKRRSTPLGLSNVKLLNLALTNNLVKDTHENINDLQKSTFRFKHIENTIDIINSVFNDFNKQEEMMTGLINVTDMVRESEIGFDTHIAIKRTIIAMTMKTRGLKAQTSVDSRTTNIQSVEPLMLSAMCTHLGKIKMKDFSHAKLNDEEMLYLRRLPLLSYLMIAHETKIDFIVKRNILNQRRTIQNNLINNNYPNYEWLIKSLQQILIKSVHLGKKSLVRDIQLQIKFLEQNQSYNEDANILAISSEFASLTSDVKWRKAFTPIEAVKMIINNSFFTYSKKILREFLDYVAISLCDNAMILNTEDYIIMSTTSHTGEEHFEIGIIKEIDRFQSRPKVLRFGSINLDTNFKSKVLKTRWDLTSVQITKRIAKLTLNQDYTRNIVYFIDPINDRALFEIILQISPV